MWQMPASLPPLGGDLYPSALLPPTQGAVKPAGPTGLAMLEAGLNSHHAMVAVPAEGQLSGGQPTDTAHGPRPARPCPGVHEV